MSNEKTVKEPLNCFLLVDDDKAINFLNERVIQKTKPGIAVKATESGPEALEYLTGTGRYQHLEQPPMPGVIFLDLNMPGMSGWEFMTEYRKLEPEQKDRIAIAILTTSINPDDEKRARREEDVDGYLMKPLTPEKIQEFVKRMWAEN